MYKARTYRRWAKDNSLISFEVIERETDLLISAEKNLEGRSRESLLKYRGHIEEYVSRFEDFRSSLTPITIAEDAYLIIKSMGESSGMAGVGPMASVAGAISEFVGRDLLAYSGEVIVENGGDIFLRALKKKVMGVYAGEDSPFTGKLALEIPPAPDGLGICTSSGTVSHSLSFGRADASLIIADSAPLADAVATAAGNTVKSPSDVEECINFARSIKGVRGALILIGDKMGSWGEIKLI